MPTTMAVVVGALAVGVLLFVALMWWLIRGRRASPLLEVDKFDTARSVTTRWAEDPSSSPDAVKPLMKSQQPDDD